MLPPQKDVLPEEEASWDIGLSIKVKRSFVQKNPEKYGKRCKHIEQWKANITSLRNHTTSWQVLRSAEEEETVSLCVLTGSYLCLPRACGETQRKAISRCPGGVRDVRAPRQEQGKGSPPPKKKILWPFLMLETLHTMYTDFSSLWYISSFRGDWDSRRPSLGRLDSTGFSGNLRASTTSAVHYPKPPAQV